MDILRKIIAGICAVLFVISGVSALLAFNIESKAFTSTTYKQAFEKQKLYERMPEILASALHTSILQNVNADPYLKALTVENWNATIISLLPPAEIKALTDSTLDSVFNYLNGNTNSVVISLLPFKQHLAGPSGIEFVKQMLRAQPTCTSEQLLQLGLGFLGGDISLCNPPEELMGLMTPLIESQLQVMTVTLPNEITLISEIQNGTPADPRIRLNQIRVLLKITPVFPMLFLFVITVFAVRSLVDWLKWWGYPFLITGAISSLIAWIGSPTFGFIMERVLQNQGAGLIPPIFLATMRETASAVTEQILKPVMIEGIVLAALGLAMIVTAYIAKNKFA
jgi:hypothetical protein